MSSSWQAGAETKGSGKKQKIDQLGRNKYRESGTATRPRANKCERVRKARESRGKEGGRGEQSEEKSLRAEWIATTADCDRARVALGATERIRRARIEMYRDDQKAGSPSPAVQASLSWAAGKPRRGSI
eukprot:5778491-Pleurochrysis_carterae.AAC.1